jgi:MFS family permease
VIQKKLQRSLTGERLQVPGALKHKAPVLPVPAWQLSFPHVAVATLTSVLFGYHIGVVNVPLQYIAKDLGFAGNALIQGLVVSICLVGAFMGCAASGMVADKYGRRRAFQLSSVPMICGAAFSALALNVPCMLLGRFLVGVGLGLSGPVTALYISEVCPLFW